MDEGMREKIKAGMDKNVESVCQEMLTRSILGLQKYGTTTMRDDVDLIGWLRHLQHELMDATVYIEAAIRKMNNQ
jgi:hypothetical protein